ncbi:type II toxin-antitoxin system RatA family toxin [Candidatus Aalborgicola defluviihabitans]|jgi:ribosome-associated toxin RatA of RatAB toxin-antitoxin module|uniref:type II toxin-antitoxin system RatA family toxin n=1 Tax=Candidatus Aalborgicola defluviihabitans TaxID=3386187 RepID=UPI001DC3AD90|nr:type II toxin-antitoxin system RatA family toxin [Burkholderiales bacterium]MBK6567775.1 type II toxin-antitoxin system RatA family toxin [Burkholderiales bacterium]MBK7282185.1 type II toxin-antitoxin system RatA family toxin [Burkholderiales bacterium]
MKTVHKSVLIWYTPQEMYVLVTDVNRYAEFLPWCDHARVVEEHEDGMTAEMGIAFGGVQQNFSTRNVHTPGSRVDMQLQNGPFSKLDGHWVFSALGDGSQRACKVELTLNYGFDSATLAKLVGPVFDKIAADLVDAFVKRAQQVYGD